MIIQFTRNQARLSGAAIFASDMQQCGWLGSFTSNTTIIFDPPDGVLNSTSNYPFQYTYVGREWGGEGEGGRGRGRGEGGEGRGREGEGRGGIEGKGEEEGGGRGREGERREREGGRKEGGRGERERGEKGREGEGRERERGKKGCQILYYYAGTTHYFLRVEMWLDPLQQIWLPLRLI